MTNQQAKLIMFGLILGLTEHTAAMQCSASYMSRAPHSCYRILKINSTRNEAQIMCSSDGGNLVGIRSPEDQIFYSGAIEEQGFQRAWIGAKRETPPHNIWRNIKDNSKITNQGCYRYDPDHTDFDFDAGYVFHNATTHEKCLEFCRGLQGNFQYAALTEGRKCGCGPGDFSKETSFNSGRKDPSEHGCTEECSGTNNQGNTQNKTYCGGAHFLTILDLDGNGYSSWAYNQPNNFDEYHEKGYQSCATLDTRINKNKLNDQQCSNSYQYICENTTGHFTVKTTQRDWYRARYDCVKDGGDLVKLENQADIDLLMNNYLNKETQYWTGLTSLLWFWQFGDVILHTGWSSGEPNNVDHTCAYLDSGNWYDAKCEGEYREGFICEKYDDIIAQYTTTLSPDHPVPVVFTGENNTRTTRKHIDAS